MYKFLAYTAMLEKKRGEHLKKHPSDDGFAMELNMFPAYYKERLLLDAKNKPRPINEEELLEYKVQPHELLKEEDVPINEREADYFKGYEKYKDNKSK